MAINDPLVELRAICTGFPEVTERLSHGAPTWFVRGRTAFVTFWTDGHHEHGFPHVWCAAPPGVQQKLIAERPDRVFRPPYVGHRGWLGVRMDGDVDWAEIAELCEDAYRVVAPRRLVEELDADG
ncbi:MAG TPA: MmcQ/YjbR family DNA-binding protein [Micromonosporaceae bacterium]